MVPDTIKYAVIDYSSLTDPMISDLLQSSKESCRRSVSGADRVIISWDGQKPDSVGIVTEYTHDQMLTIVDDQDGDWYSDPNSQLEP